MSDTFWDGFFWEVQHVTHDWQDAAGVQLRHRKQPFVIRREVPTSSWSCDLEITGILCQIITGDVSGAGTDGRVYLGLGGREFCMNLVMRPVHAGQG